jgi:hypothetical protein
MIRRLKSRTIIIGILITALLSGCKKSDSDDKTQFSFTYKGQIYNYSIVNNIANGGVGKTVDGTVFISINMPDKFGGTIYYQQGCAYLAPEFTSINLGQGCTLSETQVSGDSVPIDSEKVFLYQSGSLNVSFSNCANQTGYDPFTGTNYAYTTCDANGTFDLTLMNNNDSTIKITDGVVKNFHLQF